MSEGPLALRVAEVAYSPSLFAGLRSVTLDLAEYPEPFRMLSAAADAPLVALLGEHPVARIRVPPDLRAREPLFRAFDTSVTRSVHSQPPHLDHPHRPGDPRRYNLFWAERARANASTYFLPLGLLGPVAGYLTRFLRANAEAWEQSQPKLAMYAEDPLSMSRYLVPRAAIEAYVGLVREGVEASWSRLTPFGQVTTAARILGNTAVITEFLPAFFAWVEAGYPGALHLERWSEPCLVLADDTRCLHGRYGSGESGGHFYRTWISIDSGATPNEAFSYLSDRPASSALRHSEP